jgi:ribosomal protein S21
VSEIKRRKGESFESFVRRVKRRWLSSGKLIQARKIQFFEEKKSRNEQRKRTLSRLKINSKTEYLRKIGKLPPEEPKFKRR